MKIIAILLTFVLAFSFVACGTTEEESQDSSLTGSNATVSDDLSQAVSDDESDTTTSEVTSEDASEETSQESSQDVSTEESDTEPPQRLYDLVLVKKATTAPTIDGDVTEGEYSTVIKFDLKSNLWSSGSSESAKAYDVAVYLSWDENYLYSAVAAKVGKPRTFDNTNFTQQRPYIFDRRHVMTAIVTGDPADPKYLPPSGDSWDWSAAYSSGLASEWTVTAQPDGSNICTDHFGSVTTNKDFKYVVGVSRLETEYYEQAIPWDALAHGAQFDPKAGAIFGYAFTCCCEEVDITVDEDPNAIYACFGNGITSYKNFAEYVAITLDD